MNYDFKENQSSIENYSDLMKEYLKNIPTKEYLSNINYDKPITTIEPLSPIKINYIPNQSPFKDNFKGKEIEYINKHKAIDKTIEREKEKERKKKLEYQQYLNQQIEEKKLRKKKEKEEQLKEELLYEQKFFQEKPSNKNNSNYNNDNQGNKNSNVFTDYNQNNNNNFINNTNQIAEELFLEHPKLKQIMQRNQLTSLIDEPELKPQMNYLQQSNHQPLIIQQQALPQQHPLNDIAPNQMANNNNIHPSYMNQYNNPNGTNMSTPIMNINHPLNNVSSHQLYSSNNNLLITNNNRDNFSQMPISQSLNGIQRTANNNHNPNYPPILEKMLDYFFQEQVKIIKDYKETIEKLKNERDQALYVNTANDKKIQALERLKSDQVKFTNNYGFNPYENNYDKKVEDTLTSMIEKEYPSCHFKSKYEGCCLDLNEEPIFNDAEGKYSMIGESKFVKQTGDRKLIETWNKEDKDYAEDQNEYINKDMNRDRDADTDRNKDKILNDNDISEITQRNPCDDKSFDPDINSLDKNEEKEKGIENEIERDRHNNSLSETNENICYPDFYRDEEDDKESVKELSGEILINKDNNVRQETNQMILNINEANYDNPIKPKINPKYKGSFKETLRYKDDNANERDNSEDNMDFPIETSDINKYVNIDMNIKKVTLKKDNAEQSRSNKNKSFSSPDTSNANSNINNNDHEHEHDNTNENDSQRHNCISIANNIDYNSNRHKKINNADIDNYDEYNVNLSKPKEHFLKSNLDPEADMKSITKSKTEIIKNDQYSPFEPRANKDYFANEEEPKLSDFNPVTSSNCNSEYSKQQGYSINPKEYSNERESSSNGDVFQNKMTFFEDNNSQYDQESSIIKSSKHVIGNIYTAKTNPIIRVPPREATKKNISNMNSFYEKIKQKKKERQSTESSKVEEGTLLDESLNTFNTNLRNDTMNEKIIQKVQKYTKVALDQIDQSQLSIFQKPTK